MKLDGVLQRRIRVLFTLILATEVKLIRGGMLVSSSPVNVECPL